MGSLRCVFVNTSVEHQSCGSHLSLTSRKSQRGIAKSESTKTKKTEEQKERITRLVFNLIKTFKIPNSLCKHSFAQVASVSKKNSSKIAVMIFLLSMASYNKKNEREMIQKMP